MSERLRNVIRNFVLGGMAKILAMVFPFVTRTVFIRLLGEEYLGVGGLFTSILTMLNLSELGLSSAVVYTMYRPLAEKDNEEVASLLDFYRRIYTYIMLFILGAGLILVPFLGRIVNTELPISEVRVYYILFLLNSAASYLYVWKSSLIQADQKQYIVTAAQTAFTMLTQVLQILILLLRRDYTLYLAAALTCTVLNNVYISMRADRMYPDIVRISPRPLGAEKRKSIFTDVRAMFSYKIGGVFLNSTDNFYINSLINVRTVGRYGNYVTLSTTLTTFATYAYQSMIHSVGDFNVDHTEAEKKKLFDEILLLFSFVGVIIFAGFYCMSSRIITVWLGAERVIDNMTVMALSINVFLPLILYPIWMFRRTTGVFRQTKNILIYAGVVNLILSYVFGKQFGLAGIIIATSASRLLTSFWFEPVILYRAIFPSSHVSDYFLTVVRNFLIGLLSIFCFSRLSGYLPGGILGALAGIFVSFVITMFWLIIFNLRNRSMNSLFNTVKSVLKRFRR